MRLAVTYALLDMSNVIRPEHLQAALALWEYAERSVVYLFQGRLGNNLAERILEALAQHPEGMTRTEITDHFSRHKSAADIYTALHLLEAHGFAHLEKKDTGGRPLEVWHIGKEDAKEAK